RIPPGGRRGRRRGSRPASSDGWRGTARSDSSRATLPGRSTRPRGCRSGRKGGPAPERSEGSGPFENDGRRQSHVPLRRSTAVRVFIELSGEHPTLPRAAALAAMASARVGLGEEFVFGRVLHRVDRSRLEATKVANRPFSLPISLHPKFARALVNLARVPMAGTVLDPFCGTGGVLLEAAELGLRGVGID